MRELAGNAEYLDRLGVSLHLPSLRDDSGRGHGFRYNAAVLIRTVMQATRLRNMGQLSAVLHDAVALVVPPALQAPLQEELNATPQLPAKSTVQRARVLFGCAFSLAARSFLAKPTAP